MTRFESLPDNPDILNCTAEEMTMLVVSLATGMERAKLDPDYFDFSYQSVTDQICKATFTGRSYSKQGKRGLWSGAKTIEITRAKFNRGTKKIQLVVAFRPGMTMEHILRALEATYAFKVTPSELLIKNATTGIYGGFSGSLRPSTMLLEMRFSPSQPRINPIDSEFTIRLDNSGRPDINDYLHIIKAGSVTGGL